MIIKLFFSDINHESSSYVSEFKKYSVIPHNVLASDYLTDCHQAPFFQQDTLVY